MRVFWLFVFIILLPSKAITIEKITVESVQDKLGFTPGGYDLINDEEACVSGYFQLEEIDDSVNLMASGTPVAIDIGLPESKSKDPETKCTETISSVVSPKQLVFVNTTLCPDGIRNSVKRTMSFTKTTIEYSQVVVINGKVHDPYLCQLKLVEPAVAN